MMRMRWIYGVMPAVIAAAVDCGGGSTPPAESPSATPSAAPDAAAETPSAAAAPSAQPPAETSDVAPAGTEVGEVDEDESIADLREHHRHHHHGGFAMFVAMSLDSLGTTPDQSASITKIQTDMHAKMKPARDAEKKLLLVLADGVAADKIDKKKVDAAIADLSTTAAGVHDAVTDSLNQLHALLTPSQRLALVQKVEAHFEVWNHANSDSEPAERDAHGGHLGSLAKELKLTPDQVAKVRAKFKSSLEGSHAHFDREESEKHLKAFGDAFASDTFDAKTLTTGGAANAHIASWGGIRTAHFYEALSPVLTADQRTKVAESLRRHANYKITPTGT